MNPGLACPRCHAPLESASATELRCAADDLSFHQIDGIWRCLLPERQRHFEQFMQEYETVRRAEGRWSADPAYFQALPFGKGDGQSPADWRIRAASYRALLRRVVQPAERSGQPLHIVDLGAGNCWLSHRLARRGHLLVAVDLQVNTWDGLGAHIHYPVVLTPVQAEFDHLPVQDRQVDLVIYNSSFHYAEDYISALSEALRCLKPGGRVVVMDTPIYRDAASGRQMVREREQAFEATHGFRSNALRSENFLTYDRLEEIGQALALRWTIYRPFYGFRWMLRPIAARIRGRREPAAFALLVTSGGVSAQR